MMVVVAMRMAMAMSVIMPMMLVAVIIMVVMVPMVMAMTVVVIVSMIMVVVAAAAIGSMLVMRHLAGGRRVHHSLQFGIRRLVLEAGIFAAEREGRRIVEGWLHGHRLQRCRLGMAVHGCPGRPCSRQKSGSRQEASQSPLHGQFFQAAADTLDMEVWWLSWRCPTSA